MRKHAVLMAVACLVFGASHAAEREREVLRTMYEALGGDGWVRSNGWLTDAPVGE